MSELQGKYEVEQKIISDVRTKRLTILALMQAEKQRAERIKILIGRGWLADGARFLADKEMPLSMRWRLFGKTQEPKKECGRCGYKGAALDWHHIHGRKRSDETIVLCANCHREIHAGEPMEKP